MYLYGSTPNQLFVNHVLEKTELLGDISLYVNEKRNENPVTKNLDSYSCKFIGRLNAGK